MTPILRSIATVSALGLLAGCVAGGGVENPAAEYLSDSIRADRLTAETTGLVRTAAASMPTTGRAEYEGVVGMAFGAAPTDIATAQMLGEVDLTANFANGEISGEFDDFNTATGHELDGRLQVSKGIITGSGFTADIAGNLTAGSTSTPGTVPGAVSGSVSGEFLGTNAGAIEGTGTATSTGGTLGLVFIGVQDRD